MSVYKVSRSRFRVIFGRWLFIINAFVLAINAIFLSFLVFGSRSSHDVSGDALKAADHFRMDVGWEKEPLVLLVDKEFPRKDSFMFFDSRQQLLVSGDPVIEEYVGDVTRKAAISLGADFSLSCYYSPDNGIRVHELWLSKKGESFIDLNADGVFDVRCPLDIEQPHPVQVMYNGQWHDTAEGSKYRKRLQNGGVVEFDKQSGRWLSPMDGPDIINRADP